MKVASKVAIVLRREGVEFLPVGERHMDEIPASEVARKINEGLVSLGHKSDFCSLENFCWAVRWGAGRTAYVFGTNQSTTMIYYELIDKTWLTFEIGDRPQNFIPALCRLLVDGRAPIGVATEVDRWQ